MKRSVGDAVSCLEKLSAISGQPSARSSSAAMITAALIAVSFCAPLRAQQISLQALVTPSTTISRDGHAVTFSLH